MTKDDDDYRKELIDAHVCPHHRLSKQSIGFVGANGRRETDLGLSGIYFDFDGGAPGCTKVQDDPVGCHITPTIGGDALSLSHASHGERPASSLSGESSPSMEPLSSPLASWKVASDEETTPKGDVSKNEA